VGLRCPHCQGHVRPLIRRFGEQYAGRQRHCLRCGTIWHLNRDRHQILLVGAATVVLVVAVAPYVFLSAKYADIWFVCWLAAAAGVIWPVGFHLLWKWKLRR
jgi:hypothetical protein